MKARTEVTASPGDKHFLEFKLLRLEYWSSTWMIVGAEKATHCLSRNLDYLSKIESQVCPQKSKYFKKNSGTVQRCKWPWKEFIDKRIVLKDEEWSILTLDRKEVLWRKDKKSRILWQDDITELNQYKLAKSTSALIDKLEEENRGELNPVWIEMYWGMVKICIWGSRRIFFKRRVAYKVSFSATLFLPWGDQC